MKANELKVKDLMIGDWVDVYHELTDESGFYKPLRVTGIHYNDGICFGDSTIESPWNDLKEFEEGVRPIPLTPEILEKNGFGCDRNDGYAILKLEDNSELLYYFHEYKLTRFYKSEIIFRCQCVYVHQLQRALKLCGVSKEIVV